MKERGVNRNKQMRSQLMTKKTQTKIERKKFKKIIDHVNRRVIRQDQEIHGRSRQQKRDAERSKPAQQECLPKTMLMVTSAVGFLMSWAPWPLATLPKARTAELLRDCMLAQHAISKVLTSNAQMLAHVGGGARFWITCHARTESSGAGRAT
jgi:hypothetical protein